MDQEKLNALAALSIQKENFKNISQYIHSTNKVSLNGSLPWKLDAHNFYEYINEWVNAWYNNFIFPT